MSTPVTVTCPECGARLKSRESLRKRRPCPQCQLPFELTEGDARNRRQATATGH